MIRYVRPCIILMSCKLLSELATHQIIRWTTWTGSRSLSAFCCKSWIDVLNGFVTKQICDPALPFSQKLSRNLGSSKEGLRLLTAFKIGISTVFAWSDALTVKILTAKYTRSWAHKTSQVDERESYPSLRMTSYLPPLSFWWISAG